MYSIMFSIITMDDEVIHFMVKQMSKSNETNYEKWIAIYDYSKIYSDLLLLVS